MKTHPECIPCFLRLSLEVARLAGADPTQQERILLEVCARVSRMDTSQPPPAMARQIHDLIRELTGSDDPFREAKVRFNRFILERLQHYRTRVESSPAPFETALRLAVGGNIIDFGIHADLSESQVESALEQALAAPLPDAPIESLREAVRTCRRLLYVGDNAGEVVFDRLFIEEIKRLNPSLEVTFVVRGGPVLNDITLEDALQAGIDSLARVIDNGDNAPGCVLENCSTEFHESLLSADLVIVKGQGNFETLNGLDRPAFYLLKAKCEVIARETGTRNGTLLVLEYTPLTARPRV